jgi:hypothetical protein
MATTYDPTLPTKKDWVRLLTGDRDIAVSTVTDEEINAVLATYGDNEYVASFYIGMTIYNSNRRIVKEQVDDLRIDYAEPDDAGDVYLKYLKSLLMKGNSGGTAVFRILR